MHTTFVLLCLLNNAIKLKLLHSIIPEARAHSVISTGMAVAPKNQNIKKFPPTTISTVSLNVLKQTLLKMSSNNNLPPLFILYGSATGNSEHIAKDLTKKYTANKPEFVSEVICTELNKFKKHQKYWDEELNGPVAKYPVIVVISTTGNGDAPENGGRFVRFIKRKNNVESQPFRNVVYAVLGKLL